MKKILVTGGLGYIGSVLVPRLQSQGYEVCVRDYGLFEDCAIIKDAPNDYLFSDCRAFDAKWLDGFDVVVHLAAFSNDPTDKLHPDQLYPPSLAYSEQIAAACKKKGLRFIFASSCSVYGIADGIVSEQSDINPQTGYARNKYDVERKLALLGDKDFRPIALRFGTIYGFSPRIRFDLVINMLSGMAIVDGEITLNSDGKSWRPHLHIEDAALAIEHAIQAEDGTLDEGLNVFNVGQESDNRAIIDVAQLVAKYADNVPVKFLAQASDVKNKELVRDQNVRGGVDVRSYRVNFDKIRSRFGFAPRWQLETGIEGLVLKLKNLRLDDAMFHSPRFYRLPWTDLLVKEGRLTNKLFWNESKAAAQ